MVVLVVAARVHDPLDLQRLRRLQEALEPVLWHGHGPVVHVRHQRLQHLRGGGGFGEQALFELRL